MELILKNYKSFSEENPLNLKIDDNIIALIGPNNAGKSSVLKFFYEFRHFFNEILNIPILILGNQTSVINFNISHPFKLFYNYNSGPLEVVLKFKNFKLSVHFNRSNPTKAYLNLFIFINNQEFSFSKLQKNKITKIRQVGKLTQIWDISNDKLLCDVTELFKSLKIFRDARFFSSFRNAVNIGTTQPYCDILVGDAFIRAWHQLSTSSDPRLKKKSRKVISDLKEVFGYESLEIIAYPKKGKIITKIDKQIYDLSDLSSGIIQFILFFVNVAFYEPSLLLIEEPELNLHSKLQIDLLNRLLPYSKNGIIFTTHNMGLAHSMAGRIYSVIKSNKNSVISLFEETPNFQEFLGEINFSSFPALGLKKVLLAEGPKDVQVFTQLLKKFKKYKDIMILSLGGSSLINSKTMQEVGEIKRLGHKVKFFCWIDSEKNFAEDKVARERLEFAKICKQLNIKIKISERKCMENYFSLKAIQDILPKIKSFGLYENPKWDKGINWKIAQRLNEKDLIGTDLYKFIKSL